jgi:hypothetical protein
MLPTYLLAGDTFKTRWKHDQYPSDEYALKLYITGPSSLTVTADTEPDGGFLLTITAAQSAILKEGIHFYTVRAQKNAEVYTVASGTVTVKPNPALGPNKIVLAQRMVELIEKALTTQLEDGEAVEAISISGRSLTNINRLELLEERKLWYQELNKLKRGLSGDSGIKTVRLNASRL